MNENEMQMEITINNIIGPRASANNSPYYIYNTDKGKIYHFANASLKQGGRYNITAEKSKWGFNLSQILSELPPLPPTPANTQNISNVSWISLNKDAQILWQTIFKGTTDVAKEMIKEAKITELPTIMDLILHVTRDIFKEVLETKPASKIEQPEKPVDNNMPTADVSIYFDPTVNPSLATTPATANPIITSTPTTDPAPKTINASTPTAPTTDTGINKDVNQLLQSRFKAIIEKYSSQ
jgi:hypothetical protein